MPSRRTAAGLTELDIEREMAQGGMMEREVCVCVSLWTGSTESYLVVAGGAAGCRAPPKAS